LSFQQRIHILVVHAPLEIGAQLWVFGSPGADLVGQVSVTATFASPASASKKILRISVRR
jgi:hypothetical protein